MLVIRLARGGAKKRPFYHLVATNSRNARDGRYIERLGYYSPLAHGQDLVLNLNSDRISYWTEQGAQLSDKVAWLLKQSKLNANQPITAPVRAKKAPPKKKVAKDDGKVEAEAKAETEATEAAAPEVTKDNAEPKEAE